MPRAPTRPLTGAALVTALVTILALSSARPTRASPATAGPRGGLSGPVEEVVLYREGELVRAWEHVREVSFEEEVRAPSAYVFSARAGRGRLVTSAVWIEPEAPRP